MYRLYNVLYSDFLEIRPIFNELLVYPIDVYIDEMNKNGDERGEEKKTVNNKKSEEEQIFFEKKKRKNEMSWLS